MTSTYNDAYLLDESLAYHLSINHFRNPIFDGNIYGTYSSDQHSDRHEYDQIGRLSIQSNCGDPTNELVRMPEKSEGDCSSEQAFNQENWMQVYFRKRLRRFNDFCDNLTLTLKGKLFVIELNLKRRLNVIKEYLDRRLESRILQPNLRCDQADVPRRCNVNDNVGYSNSYLGVVDDTEIHRRSCLKYVFENGQFWDDLKIPKTRECLRNQKYRMLRHLDTVRLLSECLFHKKGAELDLEDEFDETLSNSECCTKTPSLEAANDVVWDDMMREWPPHTAHSQPKYTSCGLMNGFYQTDDVAPASNEGSSSMEWAGGFLTKSAGPTSNSSAYIGKKANKLKTIASKAVGFSSSSSSSSSTASSMGTKPTTEFPPRVSIQ